MATALVILAEGAEEMEAVIVIDTLRRAGLEVTVAGLAGRQAIKCSRLITILPDTCLTEVSSQLFDVVILPGGGGGAKLLGESSLVGEVLKKHEKADKLIAAICAAPTALMSHNIGVGKTVTSYPAMKQQLDGYYTYSEERVVTDGKMITSRSPGTAFEFALTIVEHLVGTEKKESLIDQMLLKM